jgi:hypothetical protein
MGTVRERLLIAFKYLASFRKRDWQLEDYPVRLRRQDMSPETPAVQPWVAQVLNWWLVGTGATPEAALNDLRDRIEAARNSRDLPRPGSRPPIEFAPATHLGAHGDFAYEFVERVTGIRPMFMSDQTSLHDFASGDEMTEVLRKISLLYNVDAAEHVDAPLWELLDRVHPPDGAAEQRVAADETREG